MKNQTYLALIKILIGNLLMGFAYAKWMKPNAIINGGVTSVAMILEKITGLNILYLTNGVTVLLLIFCWIYLGKENFFKSIYSSVCYNAAFSFFYLMPLDAQMTLPIDFLFASLFISLGYYACLSSNASTVGMDVIALVLYKKNPKLNLATTIRNINFIVLAFGFFTYGWLSVGIGLLFSYFYAFILKYLLEAYRVGKFI